MKTTTPNDVTLKKQALCELALDEFEKLINKPLPPFVSRVYVMDVVHKATQRVCYESCIDYYGRNTSHKIVYTSYESEIPDTEHIDEFISKFDLSEINLTNFEVLIEAFGKFYHL